MACNCEKNKTAGFAKGVVDCQSDGKPGYKADYDGGEKGRGGGKCFTYTPGDEASRKQAKYKAFKQLYAIEKSMGVYTSSNKIAELGDDIDMMEFMRWMSENFPHESTEVQIFAKKEGAGKMPGRSAGKLKTESVKRMSQRRISNKQIGPDSKGQMIEEFDVVIYNDAPGMDSDIYVATSLGLSNVYGDSGDIAWHDMLYVESNLYWTAIGTRSCTKTDEKLIPTDESGDYYEVVKRTARRKRAEMDKNFGELGDMDFVDHSADIVSEIDNIHQKQMNDTARSTDTDNRTPDTTSENPASSEWVSATKGFAKTQSSKDFSARIIVEKKNKGRSLLTARVVIADPTTKTVARGRIAAVGVREFSVLWDDKTVTVEEKKNFKLD